MLLAPTPGAPTPADLATRYGADLRAAGARSVSANERLPNAVGVTWPIEYDAFGASAAFESTIAGVEMLHHGSPGIRIDITDPLRLIGRLPGVQAVLRDGMQARVVVDSQATIDHLDPLVRDVLHAQNGWTPSWDGVRIVFATA